MPSLQAGSPSSSSMTPLQPLSSGEADVRGSGVSPDAARQEKGLGHPQVTYRSLLEKSAAEVEHGWLPGRRRRADWLQGCPWLPGCNPMDCSLPGSRVILQERILEWLSCPPPGHLLNPGVEPCLPCCRWILYCLSHKGGPRILDWVAYPFSRGSSQPRD